MGIETKYIEFSILSVRDGFRIVCCSHCHTTDVVKNGKSAEGKQRHRCRNTDCSRASFILNYTYRSHVLVVKQQVSELAMNDSGIRDMAWVLMISSTKVIEELKKTLMSEPINRSALASRLGASSASMSNTLCCIKPHTFPG